MDLEKTFDAVINNILSKKLGNYKAYGTIMLASRYFNNQGQTWSNLKNIVYFPNGDLRNFTGLHTSTATFSGRN